MPLYAIRQEDGRCLFTPSSLFVRVMAGGFGAGSAFLIYLSTFFFRSGSAAGAFWFGILFILVAVLPAGLGIHAWRTGGTPLTIERGGRVSYGERELCATGTVRAVRIAPSKGGERGDCEVLLELDEGRLVSLPSLYFPGFQSRAHARPFAREVADALGVPVAE